MSKLFKLKMKIFFLILQGYEEGKIVIVVDVM